MAEHQKITGAFFFLIDLVTKMDEMQAIAAQALDTEEKPLEHYKRNVAMKRLQEFATVLSRNLVVSTADNLLCYVSEILQEVVKKRHEVLRSSEKLTTEEALQFDKFGDLISFIADRKINELAYGGLRAMTDFVGDRLGVAMFEDDDKRMLVSILVELRNIHTHNRGVINRLFLNRVGVAEYAAFKFKLGMRYHVKFDEYQTLSSSAIAVAVRLDELLTKKFRLKRVSRKTIPQPKSKSAEKRQASPAGTPA